MSGRTDRWDGTHLNEKKLVAMIPARLGSKRIPKKNIRYMYGKPLIQYAVDLCLQCDVFDSIWVNTESHELGKVVVAMGARFHERPAELAGDSVTNREYTYEFLKKHDCDYVVMVNTTSPLLRPDTVTAFVDFLNTNDYDTVLSVVELKEETFFEGKPLNFKLSEKVNSQTLEPTEAVVWALTAWKRDVFISLQDSGINPVYGGRIGRFKVPKDESCDLDTEEDWRIAEGILTSRNLNEDRRYLQI